MEKRLRAYHPGSDSHGLGQTVNATALQVANVYQHNVNNVSQRTNLFQQNLFQPQQHLLRHNNVYQQQTMYINNNVKPQTAHTAPIPVSPAPTSATLPTLEETGLVSVWEGRSPAYLRLSKSYQDCMKRFLPLTSFPQQRFAMLMAAGDAAKPTPWKFSTRASYWVAMMTSLELRGMQATPDDKRNLKWLEAQAIRQLPDQCPPLTISMLHQVMYSPICLQDEAIILLTVTWLLGQRVSDMVLLQLPWIRTLQTPQGNFLMLTLVEGKVIGKIRPYTLSLDMTSPVAASLYRLAQSQMLNSNGTKTTQRLFSEQALSRCRTILHTIDPALQLRSIRRGGLQHMALMGVPLPEILTFSKHTTISMLTLYLDKGACLLSNAISQTGVTNVMMRTITNAWFA